MLQPGCAQAHAAALPSPSPCCRHPLPAFPCLASKAIPCACTPHSLPLHTPYIYCTTGASARAAEEAAPEALKDAALAVLRRVHPGAEVPEPLAYTVSKWASGKLCRGLGGVCGLAGGWGRRRCQEQAGRAHVVDAQEGQRRAGGWL